MIPVLSPADVKAIDEQALRTESLEDILDRVGSAVAREAVDMLGASQHGHVVALVGPGLNGSDARAAATHLEGQGIGVDLVEVSDAPTQLPACDLIIDGAFGIGLNKPWTAPSTGTTPVLSIDIPSGIDGLTGEALGTPIVATRTATFIGYKSGLLFGDGPDHSGEVHVVDIGLAAGDVSTGLIEAPDVRSWLPRRGRNAHKWQSALLVVAGSDGMTGAAKLACAAAMRAGAGYVHLDTPAANVPGLLDVVVGSFAGTGARAETEKFRAAVVGPGLSRTTAAQELVRTVLSVLDVPVVVDGDGLAAVAAVPEVLVDRPATARAVLTPHDGEFERLTGSPPGVDRIAAARSLALDLNAVVLLKGATTVIADPTGDVRISTTGDERLATAGTGDVLAGIVGALLAQGAEPFDAAAAGAYLHGAAARLGHRRGLIASDLIDLIPLVFGDIYDIHVTNVAK